MIVSSRAVVVLLAISYCNAQDEGETCPHYETIFPCTCSSKFFALDIYCPRVRSEQNLIDVMTALTNKTVRTFTLGVERTNRFYPTECFSLLQPRHIFIRNCPIGSYGKQQSKAFAGNTKTEKLSIFDSMKATDYTGLNELRGLRELELHNVSLPNISYATLELTPTIQSIRINNAPVTTIDDYYFAEFANLKHIDIAFTQLRKLTKSSFITEFENELEEVMLSSNELEEIEEGIFLEVPKMRTLDVSSNHLETINQRWFHPFFQGHIIAHGNPLNCKKDLLWLVKFLSKDQRRRVSCANGHNLVDYLEYMHS